MSGKGSKYRPLTVDRETWDKNWKRIFGDNKPKDEKDKKKDK